MTEVLVDSKRDPQQEDVSAMEAWQSSEGTNAPKRWKKIAHEVYWRKTLILAASRDLARRDVPNPLPLAATDVFVEKAQRFLTRRGYFLVFSGVLAGIMALAVLMAAASYVISRPLNELLSGLPLDNRSLTLLLLKASTAGGFVAGAAIFLVSLSRAALHEGTALFHRRHALRFGRLYVYLMDGKVNFKDLEEAFKWNVEFTTAFKDIKADKMIQLPVAKLVDIMRDLAKQTGKVVRKPVDSSATAESPRDE